MIFFLILGDQSTASFTSLHHQNWSQGSSVRAFVQKANSALLREVSLLPRLDRDRLPDLSTQSPSLLADWAENGISHPVLRPIITAAAQCVDLLEYLEDTQDVEFSDHCLLGSCSGLLTAAAATVFPCPSTKWIALAVRIVIIAFRIGVLTASTAERLSRNEFCHTSWSLIVQGHLRTSLVSEFNDSHDIPNPERVYVSAITPNSTTISGPPHRLTNLLKSVAFRATGLSAVSIPIFAPYHASHLYTEADITWILGADDPLVSEELVEYRPKLPLISTKDGRPFEALDMVHLLDQVVRQILNDVLRWDIVVAETPKLVRAETEVSVSTFGAPGLGKSLVAALQASGIQRVSFTPFNQASKSAGTTKDVSTQSTNPKIAIVGMAGRFPGAISADTLWNILTEGLQVHQHVPKDRFDPSTHVDPTGKRKNTSTTPYGCFIHKPGYFDPTFFRMSPREAAITDPMQRLALMSAYEALEMSGFVPNRTASSMLERAGTFYGQTIDDYREVNASQNIDPFYVTGGLRPFGPGRINYYYKFTGPSYVIDTACSSSLAAIHIACGALNSGECDMALAGGTNIITGSDMYAGLSRGQFLSPTGACKTFDNTADGYCRADGVGTVVLKRLDDAMADNDPILGVILASATNHSSNASSITQPHGPTQEKLLKAILDQARVSPSDVDYIEMHGTGTQIGDATEMCSVSSVFGDSDRDPVYVGSVKPNIGHSEAAAGVTAVVKALLMFQKSSIPPHVGIQGELNHNFPDLTTRKIFIPQRTIPFQAKADRRRKILINNFGAAGGNSTLLLEEAPSRKRSVEPASRRPAYLVTVSAKTAASLKGNKDRLSEFLQQNNQISLPDLSYTTTTRRTHYRHRFATVASTIEDVQGALVTTVDETSFAESPNIVVAFTGQGGIYTGAAQELFRISHQFRSEMVHFDQLAQDHGFRSILPLLDLSIDLSSLSTTQVQLGQVCIQMALYRLYQSWGLFAQSVIGHSLGEYAAFYASGVLTASDTIRIVGKRAELMEKHCTPGTHTMLAVRASLKTVQDSIKGTEVEIACINGPNDVVLSGRVEAIQNAATALSGEGIKSTQLPVPFACHSSQLDPILQTFEDVARGLEFHTPQIPILSPLLGHEINQGGIVDARYLVRQLRQSVDFVAALESSSLATAEDTQFVELGPHAICTGMIRNILGKTAISALRKGEDSWKTTTDSLAALYIRGINIDWQEYNRDLDSVCCLSSLPSYAFDEKNYWLEYKNDWALKKDDVSSASPVVAIPKGPCTASVQRLLSESSDEKPVMADFESDLIHPPLYNAIIGHVINDIGLCPSAVFADMAFTTAKYLFENTTDKFSEFDMDIADMEIISPVIVEVSKNQKPQCIQISARITDEKTCYIEWSDGSTGASNTGCTVYAKCSVILRDLSVVSRQWSRSKHFVTSRIDHLRSSRDAQRLNRRMAYKLFGAVVDYSDRYQGMDEVFMDGEHYEAVASVSFKADNTVGNFLRNPYWTDNITQLSGFVLNANEMTDPSKEVFISNGWESMHVAASLSHQQAYTVYVRMDQHGGGSFSGDMYVLDEQEDIICVVKGIKFQAVPRPVLKLLLTPKGIHAPQHNISSTPSSSRSTQYSMDQTLTPATSLSPHSSSRNSVAAAQHTADTQHPDQAQLVLRILCEELGVKMEELDWKTSFADIGVDSLMSLTVIGRLRELFALDFPSTMFQTNPTVDHLVKTLGGKKQSVAGVAPPQQMSTVTVTRHRATSVLLQGNLRTAADNLFLFPGGFGTSSSFTPMPSIDPKLAVFGLNSAFVNTPEDFTVSIPEMASLYLAEIRRRQQHGPYSFLGYSVGGIIAYEAARQLILEGEIVERLYLVDSPCPLVIPPMPPKLIEFLDSIDRFSGKEKEKSEEPQEAVKPMGSTHVTQTLISLEAYMSDPIPSHAPSPRTTYFVAKKGVINQPNLKRPDGTDQERRVLNWLLDDRKGLGGTGDGWEKLMDGSKLKVVPIEGNHFNIMKEPHILEWTNELRSSYWV